MRIILAALGLALFTPVWAAAQEEPAAGPDFRQTRWGLSPDEVAAAEVKARPAICAWGSVPVISNLCYIAQLNGRDYDLVYLFLDGKLARAAYISRQNYQNKNNHANDYATLKDQLTLRYGPPKRDETTWSQNLYQDSPENLGLAYSMGHVASYADWETERSHIRLEITGENLRVEVAAYYYAKETYEDLTDMLKRQTLDDL